MNLEQIQSFHAHVYFDENTYDQAFRLCEEAGRLFPLSIGHMHRKPVGPHPCWSCQLEFEPEIFGKVIPWLSLRRNGLVIFIHPNTGDDLKDHTDHTLWMGKIKKLNLSFLE